MISAGCGLVQTINEATSKAMMENNPGEDWDRYETATALASAEATLKWFADRAKSKVARGVLENALAEVINLYYHPIWPVTAAARRAAALDELGKLDGELLGGKE